MLAGSAWSCTKDKGKSDYSTAGFPQEVGEIIIKKCATAGCHNDVSRSAAAGVSLTSWTRMFEGSVSGAIVIPYRPDLSTLIYYVNSYREFGEIQLKPRMPINSSALSVDEVKILHDWIKNGAPNANGEIRFSEKTARKFYVSNQGCDMVTTFDAQTMLAARATNVGKIEGYVEAPHFIKISPDNQFWYVSFLAAGVFQKYRVSDNSFVGEANIGLGSWNTFTLNSDGQYAYIVDWSASGKIKKVKTDSMIVKRTISGLTWSHGIAINKTDDTLYVTSQMGNYLFKIPADFSQYEEIVLDNSGQPNNASSLDPHEILFSPDYSRYYVSCQESNEIKVLDANNDNLLATIAVGNFPQEMAISVSRNYLFVSCMEDLNPSYPTRRGSIYIIDCVTNTVITSLYSGHQPHGVMIDEQHGRVYVTNRNVSTGGPAPHHASLCSGRNGNVTAIDLKTLKMIPGYRAEVSVDPYGYAIMR